MSMLALLEQWEQQGILRYIDKALGEFCAEHTEPKYRDLLRVLGAYVSREFGMGHVCVSLEDLPNRPFLGMSVEEAQACVWQHLPDPTLWEAILTAQTCVSQGDRPSPLVWMADRLYLHRSWLMENIIARDLHARSQGEHEKTVSVSDAALAAFLDELFCPSLDRLWASVGGCLQDEGECRRILVDQWNIVSPEALDWPSIFRVIGSSKEAKDLLPLHTLVPTASCLDGQKVAAAVALTRQFSVISGGPGTGKTTTVTKLLASLSWQAQQQGKSINIKLVAPTGKAAARLTESVGQALTTLPLAASIRETIPTEASTLHRLLGARPDSVYLQYHQDNPLHLDVLVIDEASMVDLTMMASVLLALPKSARLILLGDCDQLASVEAGAVLGDLGQFAQQGFTQSQTARINQLTGFALPMPTQDPPSTLGDGIAFLHKSYRFHEKSGIGVLAKAINQGSGRKAFSVFGLGFEDLHYYDWQIEKQYETLLNLMVSLYRPYLCLTAEKAPEKAVLAAFSQARLLCALREGNWGVSGLNTQINRALIRANLLTTVNDETWYEGRPVMITKNDANLGLFNGDVGIALRRQLEGDPKPRLRVFFELPDGNLKAVLPSRLPEHETAFAMTIHKSQGSEFTNTVLVLPTSYSPLLTRELVYTGVTRAKQHLHLFSLDTLFERAVRTRTARQSGLKAQLLSL